MARIPGSMPAMPAGQATGRDVFEAEQARHKRKRKGVGTNEEMMERGEDSVHVFKVTAAAAGLAPAANTADAADAANQQQLLVQLQASVVQLQASIAQLQAKLDNTLRRMRNWNARTLPGGHAWPLVPLGKEQPPPAGSDAVGTLPPPDIFPDTWEAVGQLNNARLNRLAAFYGEQFGPNGGALAARRNAFARFIEM